MNLTGLKAQWNPTAAWNDELDDGDWTDIDLQMTHMWCRRGYERGEQKVKAGEFSVTYKDPTRSHDPTKSGSATIGKGRRQFRLVFTVSGTPYTFFRGLTNGNGWKPKWDGGNRFTVTVTGTDRSSAVEAIFLESVFRIVAESTNPLWWFPLEEQGGTSFYNRGSDGATPSALVVNADMNGQPILPYDKTPSASFGTDPGGSGFAGSGSHLQEPFTLSAVFATNAPGALYSQNNGTDSVSDIIFAVDWGASLGTLTLFVDDPTNPSLQINTDQVVSDKGHHIGTASYDTSGILRIKLDHHAVKVSSLVSPPYPAPRHGASMIGNTRDVAQPFTGRMQHLMAWNRVLSSTEETDLHEAALFAWAGLRSDEVVEKILDYCGIPAAERDIETGLETMGPSKLNASAMTCLQRVANTETGLFLFDREGKAAFYARDHAGSTGTTRNTKPGGTGNIGLTELDLDTDDATYYTSGVGYVSTPNPIPVTYRHANAATDGDIPWEPDTGTEFEDRDAAEAGVQRAVGAGAPVPHYTNARSVGTDGNIVELLTRDVWDELDIVAHPAGDTETQESRILQVEHEMDGTTNKWTTTLEVEAI